MCLKAFGREHRVSTQGDRRCGASAGDPHGGSRRLVHGAICGTQVDDEFARIADPHRQGKTGLPEPLVQREEAILLLLAQGLTNTEIGYKLSLAEGTVKNYITTILQKLGVRDRTQAALRARELGLLEDPAS